MPGDAADYPPAILRRWSDSPSTRSTPGRRSSIPKDQAGSWTNPRADPPVPVCPRSQNVPSSCSRRRIPTGDANASATCSCAGQLCRQVPPPLPECSTRSGYESVGVAHHATRAQGQLLRTASEVSNQLWQTDLFTFILKRQNRRVYLVAFLDDHSRFVVGYGLHASQSTALVLEVLRAAITGFGTPEEVLTDNGTQYVTWRGKSAFAKECERQGIKQIVASPHRPQTLGKVERFWGTLWRECVETAVFTDLGDARARIGLFIDHYNFQRPHQGIAGLTPADRFFGAAEEVKRTLEARVAANALELARQGVPKAPFYMTGQAGGQPFSVHAEGERMILTNGDGRKEIDLLPPGSPADAINAVLPTPVCPQAVVSATGDGFEEPPAPGESPLDEGLDRLSGDASAEGGGS